MENIKINLNKQEIKELKQLEKFKDVKSYRNLDKIIYNGSLKKIQVSNGKIGVSVDHVFNELENDNNNYIVNILNDCIILEKFNEVYANLEKVVENLNTIQTSNDIILDLTGETKKENNIRISIFINEAPAAYNIGYLQNIPSAKYTLNTNKRYDHIKTSAAILQGNIKLGKIKILIMPCIKHN